MSYSSVEMAGPHLALNVDRIRKFAVMGKKTAAEQSPKHAIQKC